MEPVDGGVELSRQKEGHSTCASLHVEKGLVLEELNHKCGWIIRSETGKKRAEDDATNWKPLTVFF